jgi:hypothetical protein
MAANLNFAAWETVPERVAALLPQALQLKQAHVQAALKSNIFGVSAATWEPATQTLKIYAVPDTWQRTKAAYAQHFTGQAEVTLAVGAPDLNREIVVKLAAWPTLNDALKLPGQAFSYATKLPGMAADATHAATGGPTPLSNAIVSGLTLGGLGYGAGTLAENLFPERYMERGRLRRTLGLLGVGAGGALGAVLAAANQRALGGTYGQNWLVPSTLKLTGEKAANFPPPDIGMVDHPGAPGMSGLMLPSIDVQRMNNAIWRDARRGYSNGFAQHTPPAYAAATSGLMSGLSTGLQSPIIRPVDVIHGIASAGVGLATATVAGTALSALAGLTPAAQNTLQDMGMWGGLMHAIVPAMFGAR